MLSRLNADPVICPWRPSGRHRNRHPALKLLLPLAAKLPLIQRCTAKIVLHVPAEVQARCSYGTSQILKPRSPAGEEENYQAQIQHFLNANILCPSQIYSFSRLLTDLKISFCVFMMSFLKISLIEVIIHEQQITLT